MNFTDPKQQLDDIYERHDKDGDGIFDAHEQKIEGDTPKYFKRHWTEKAKRFLAGHGKVSKAIGFTLDLLTFFIPGGTKIDRLREKGKQALNLNQTHNEMKDILKKLFSIEGWKKILSFRDENGNLDFKEALATVLQLGIILGLLYVAKLLDVLEPFLTLIGLQ